MWTAFDYMYRDAGNFKVFGTLILRGGFDPGDEQLIRDSLDGGEFFIAEQVGVPPIYTELYKWSDGQTESDHCWHEFLGLRTIAEPEDTSVIMRTDEVVSRFAAVARWDEAMSPNFELSDVALLLRSQKSAGATRHSTLQSS